MVVAGILPGCVIVVGAVFSWFNIQAVRILSSSLPQSSLWGVWWYPAGAAAELLDGSLKLRPSLHHPFCRRFPPWSISRLGGVFPGGATGQSGRHATTDALDEGTTRTKKIRLTRKTCPGFPVQVKPDPGRKVAPSRILRIRE